MHSIYNVYYWQYKFERMNLSGYMKGFHQIEFGGTKDALALSALAGAALLTSPFFGGYPIAQISLSLAGAGYLSWRVFAPILKSRQAIKSDTQFKSSTPPVYGGANDPDESRRFTGGLLIGYCTDTGKPVVISDDLATRHVFLAGLTGVGKTVLGNLLMYQQMQRGGGLMFIDGKCVMSSLEDVYKLCLTCGRERDLWVLNPGNHDISNTYNPILEGTPTEIASRILSLSPSTANNAGADYYRSSSFMGTAAIVSALQSAKLKFNFLDLSILLQNAKAMEDLEEKLKVAKGAGSEEYRTFAIFLDQFRVPGKQGTEAQLDMKKMKDVFGGLTSRMQTFGSGGFGKVMNTYTPEIILYEAIRQNKIVYVMLPTLGDQDAALALGKMFVADLRSCVAQIYENPSDKPDIPFLAFMDEAGSYASTSWSDLFQQARGANIVLIPAVQTVANFQDISENFCETIIGNTWTKIFMKPASHSTAEYAADFIGMQMREERSVSKGTNSSSTADTIRTTPEAKAGSGVSINESFKLTEDYWVSPDVLKGLAMGEAFVVMGKRSGEVSVYHIKVPFLKPQDSIVQGHGFKLNRLRYTGGQVKGAGFFENADKYLSRVNT